MGIKVWDYLGLSFCLISKYDPSYLLKSRFVFPIFLEKHTCFKNKSDHVWTQQNFETTKGLPRKSRRPPATSSPPYYESRKFRKLTITPKWNALPFCIKHNKIASRFVMSNDENFFLIFKWNIFLMPIESELDRYRLG